MTKTPATSPADLQPQDQGCHVVDCAVTTGMFLTIATPNSYPHDLEAPIGDRVTLCAQHAAEVPR